MPESTHQRIMDEIHQARQENREISDGVARAIAMGQAQTTMGRAFVRHGVIPRGIDGASALWRELAHDYSSKNDAGQTQLDMLGTYLINRRTRGVQIPYWSSLGAETPDTVLSVDQAMACMTLLLDQQGGPDVTDESGPNLRYGHEGEFWSIDWEPGPEEWVFKFEGPAGVLIERINTVIVGLHKI